MISCSRVLACLQALLLLSLARGPARGGRQGVVSGFEIKTLGSHMRSLMGLSSGGGPAGEQSAFRYKSYSGHLSLLRELESRCSGIMNMHRHVSQKGLYCGESRCEYIHIRLGLQEDGSDVPNMLIVSGMHGDERLSVEIATEFVRSICDQYADRRNAGVRYLLSTRSIWVVPMANPWGVYHGRRTEGEIDVNRDFPSKSGENCLESESSRMIYDLFNAKSFVFVASLHGGLRSISYGNGYYDFSDDSNKIFEFISKDLQASAGKILSEDSHAGRAGFFYDKIGSISKTVYPVKGGFEDWALFGYNIGHISCSDYIQKTHQANQGGALTFLVETDPSKAPEERSLGSRSDPFSLIDLDKLAVQPSHITRNLRLLLKLAEYVYPDVIFLNRPPETLYFGQTFALYLAVIGCYSFNNLRLKLEPDGLGPGLTESPPLYLEFLVNEGLDGTQSTIYYRRCSSIFLNNQEIRDILSRGPQLSSKDQCSDSSLLTKIVNRSFRVKNKCKSIYQFNKFKPIKLLVKVPYEAKILNQAVGEILHWRLKAEIDFDQELIQPSSRPVPDLFDRFVRLRSRTGIGVDRPVDAGWLRGGAGRPSQSGFPVKVTRPPEILQIEFSGCPGSPVPGSDKWSKSCRAFRNLAKIATSWEEAPQSPSSVSIKSYLKSNGIGAPGRQRTGLLGNLQLVGEKLSTELEGNLYVIPSEPRTSIIGRPAQGAFGGQDSVSQMPSLVENENETFVSLPYFNNVTLELIISVSEEPRSHGEYVVLNLAEFLNLLKVDMSSYQSVQEELLGPSGELKSIGIISVHDLMQDQGEETPFQSIRHISRQRIFEMVTEQHSPGDLSRENEPDLLKRHYVILRYLKGDLSSVALGKIHIDNYVQNSLGTSFQEQPPGGQHSELHLLKGVGTGIHDPSGSRDQSESDEETIDSLRSQLQSWWYNNSKDYMDFRLVLVFCGLFMAILMLILTSVKIIRYFDWVPLRSLRFELKKRFRTNSKIFTIDISSGEDEESSGEREGSSPGNRKKRRVKSRKVYDSQESSYTPRSDHKSNKSYTLSQRFNTNNSDISERPRDSPSNSLSRSLSSFDHFKSRTNTLKELEIIEMERSLDIGMRTPMQNGVSPKSMYTELSTSISRTNAKGPTGVSSPNRDHP
ncbi:putative carboxypeptidase [Cryptosporidium canis]|uniref:Carboxypeptidase n=1 Tax=Cryptosporidium canis TaxID=195482 RepID=A0A9D5DGN7_9CRYT|nr:putative carboxypeptidase [Cryptosporidium canis]